MMFSHNRITSAIVTFIIFSAVGFGIYYNSLHNSFHFDDIDDIVSNPFIRNINSLTAIWHATNHPTRFIGYYTLALNFHFHQLDVVGYHLTNIFIHILTSISLWWLIQLLFRTPGLKGMKASQHKEWIAFFAALLFLTHPIQTQAVTYIIQRIAALAALFYITSLCFYVQGRLASKGTAAFYFLCAAFMAVLGMFTKETVFTLPLTVILIEIFFFADPGEKGKNRNMAKRIFSYLFILSFLLIIPALRSFDIREILLKTFASQSHEGDTVTGATYLLTQFRVVLVYLRLLFFPVGQNVDHDFPLSRTFFEFETAGSFFVLLIIFSLGIHLFRKDRLIAFSIIWFFVTLLVESSIIPIPHVIFEHRVYLPSMGFAILAAYGLFMVFEDKKKFIAAICIMSAVFSFLTVQRNKVWRDEITLWSDVIKRSPNKSRGYDNLAAAYIDLKQYDKALENLQIAKKIYPKNIETYSNIGLIQIELGRLEEAIKNFETAISIDNKHAFPFNNLGVVYLLKKDYPKAEEAFSMAITNQPRLLEPRLNLATVYKNSGDHDKALNVYKRLVVMYPGNGGVLKDLAELYFMMGSPAKAMEAGQLILNKVNDPRVLVESGSLFAKNNYVEMALALYSRSLNIDPNSFRAYLELGKLYGNFGNFEMAIKVWEEGLSKYPDEKQFNDLIGQAKGLLSSGVPGQRE